ncbi:MAG: hypothetical protein WA063_02330 [Minisyncoccia bacterium]
MTIEFELATVLVLMGAVLVFCLVTNRNNIWNYPAVVAVYICFSIQLFAGGALFIHQIVIATLMKISVLLIIICIATVLFIVCAKKERCKN